MERIKLTPENIKEKRLQIAQNEVDIKKNLNNITNWEKLLSSGFADEEYRLEIRKMRFNLEIMEEKFKKGLHKESYKKAIEKAKFDNENLNRTIKKMKRELRNGTEVNEIELNLKGDKNG